MAKKTLDGALVKRLTEVIRKAGCTPDIDPREHARCIAAVVANAKDDSP